MTSIDGLALRKNMGRALWFTPTHFGPDGWQMESKTGNGRIIVTCSDMLGYDVDIVHASISYSDHMPTYYDLHQLHAAVWANGYAYQVFVGGEQHVNIHQYCLHLWGAVDGRPLMPELAMDLGFGVSI